MICEHFGTLPDGRDVDVFTLKSKEGLVVKITNYGGTILNLWVPGKDGKLVDIIYGFDTLEGCLTDHPFMNTLVGRYANRIATASFELDGLTYELPANQAPHQLHGGDQGFDKKLWKGEDASDEGVDRLDLTLLSPDGDMGFPGNLEVKVRYELSGNTLSIAYTASTDKSTVVNLTNHAYFNLDGKGDIRQHELKIAAGHIVAADKEGIPLEGPLMPVEGTPFDFRARKSVWEALQKDHEQLAFGKGFDRSFVLDANESNEQNLFHAETYSRESGIKMSLTTNKPAVQLYTANFLDGITGKYGIAYTPYCAFCLETQHFPNSPNRSDFPSTVLRPGETYHQLTQFNFSIEETT